MDDTIICGDFKVVLNQNTENYKHLNNPQSCQMLLNTIDKFVLVFNSRVPQIYLEKRQPKKQVRLDFLQ